MTMRELLHLYVTAWATEIKPSTSRRYRHDLTRWIKFVGNPSVEEITTATFQQFRAASAEAGEAPGTTETTLQTVRALMRCAYGHGIISKMPDRGKARRCPTPEPHPPSVEELDAFLAHVHVAKWPRRIHIPTAVWWTSLICLACFTGLRRADLLWRLAWSDIDLEGKAIRFRANKTGALHSFPITPVVERHLLAIRPQWAFEPSRLVFGPSKSPHIIYREMKRVCEAAGIRTLGLQQCRQYAVTQWSSASGEAGALVHGCGLERVLLHYLDRLTVLERVADQVKLPAALAG